MKKTNKTILGVLGLAVVIAMTIFAYTLPEPNQEPPKNPVDIARSGK